MCTIKENSPIKLHLKKTTENYGFAIYTAFPGRKHNQWLTVFTFQEKDKEELPHFTFVLFIVYEQSNHMHALAFFFFIHL